MTWALTGMDSGHMCSWTNMFPWMPGLLLMFWSSSRIYSVLIYNDQQIDLKLYGSKDKYVFSHSCVSNTYVVWTQQILLELMNYPSD